MFGKFFAFRRFLTSPVWKVIVVVWMPVVWAGPPVVLTEAQLLGVDEDAPVPLQENEKPLTPEQIKLLNQKIDVGRIDIGRLREILEWQENVSNPLRLSLQESIQMAIESNADLDVLRFEPLKSDADILMAKGEFDPLASGSAMYLRATQEASAEYKTFGGISSIEAYRTTTSWSVAGKLQWGTIYNVTLDLNKEETTFNSFIEEWNGGLTLTLDQPLLRGRGKAANFARIRMAKNAREISEYQLRVAVMTTVSEVIKAYWDLVGAVENLTVREEALANAERLLEIAQKRLDIGTGAAIEVLQAKAGVAMSQSELIAARSHMADAEELLKQIINLRKNGMLASRRIVPIDRPNIAKFEMEEFEKTTEALDESIQLALEKRPEIQMGELEIATAKIDRTRASNQMLPEINLSGSVFQGARNHYMKGVFDGVRERTDNFYTFGVRGSVPIGNRAARGAYQRTALTVQQAESRLEKTKQELALRVRLAMRALNTSQILCESNRQARVLQETNVAAEEKRLRLGVSTSYLVLQVQQDLTLAQTQEVQARIAYEKALVEVRLAEGTILESLGIEFLPPEPVRPVTFLRSVDPRGPKIDDE